MPSHGRGDTPAWRAAALLVLLCMAAIGCTRPPPEQALREAFEGLQAAIEARDAGDVASFLAEDFIGPGGLDRDGARRLAALHFLRHADVGVLRGPLDVELQDKHAPGRFGGVLSGGRGARRMAALHFLAPSHVGVLPGPLDVELQDKHARVRFGAVLSGGGSGRLLPDSARAWQVDTGWRLVDGDWRMASADWSPALR